MASSTIHSATPQTGERKWSPRFWLGCEFFAWLRIMTKGRFQFDPSHLSIGVCTSITSFAQTFLKYAHDARYGRKIAKTKITEAPVFIIGHWRTGTTLLHEMMILDPRHTFPNTYECLEPNHFLLTERLFKKWLGFMLPKRRPMDNVRVGWDRPQEDEFALCLLGQPSPYLDIIFPNRTPMSPGSLDLEGLTPPQQRKWMRTFYRFLQSLTYKDPRRLILKSPPHSCRIPTLLKMFPDARFVHIVRNPYKVFPSTIRLWKSLAEKHGVQKPNHRQVQEKVLSTFPHLYARLEEGKKLIDPSRFHELKYEELIQDPMQQMNKLYDRLNLGGFDDLRPQLSKFIVENANYETNKFQLSNDDRDEVTRRWGHVIRQYGYPVESSEIVPLPAADSHHPKSGGTISEVLPFRQPANSIGNRPVPVQAKTG